ncbi:MAG TPA: hypothetical protein VJJ72_03030 [Candidatus Paceibacterota bacterium]
MKYIFPEDDKKYHWTSHVKRKMLHYGLSPSRVLRIIKHPKRIEKGIVPETLAVMQPTGTKQKPTEVWTMYAQKKNQKVIITAWRYPGISKVREEIPIPPDILQELIREKILKSLK